MPEEPRSQSFCFTVNNPDVSGEDFLAAVGGHSSVAYLVFQLERGASGTEHFQGYAELSLRVRRSCFSRILGGASAQCGKAHVEPRRSKTSGPAIVYCKKDEGRVAGPWEAGEPRSCVPGRRSDAVSLRDVCRMAQSAPLLTVMREHPDVYVRHGSALALLANSLAAPQRPADFRPRRVVLLYGPPSCGKSFWARADALAAYDAGLAELGRVAASSSGVASGGDDPAPVGESDALLPPNNLWTSSVTGSLQWFDGYAGQTHALLDDFVGSGSQVPLSQVLLLLDQYDQTVPVKGSHVRWTPEVVYITTNIHPRQWYDYAQRAAHYDALCRRITEVMHWRKAGEEPEVLLAPPSLNSDDRSVRAASLAAWLEKPFFKGPFGRYEQVGNNRVFVVSGDQYDF